MLSLSSQHRLGNRNAYCVTASLSTAYKKPVAPLPGVFRVDITLKKVKQRMASLPIAIIIVTTRGAKCCPG